MKAKDIKFRGYFTVEAALVMPVVFVCYLAVIILLLYIYERCLLEQNAGLLPVWVKYMEEYTDLYETHGGDRMETEEAAEYILKQMDEYEENMYLLAENIYTELHIRGSRIEVERTFRYAKSGAWEHMMDQECLYLNAVDFVRLAKRLEDYQDTEEEKK